MFFSFVFLNGFTCVLLSSIHSQVSRIATHPSVVVWGANNENEQALDWYEPSRRTRDRYVVDYVQLYLETVLPAIAHADADGRPVVDTSPGEGLVTEAPYVKRWIKVKTKYKKSPIDDDLQLMMSPN